VTAALVLTTSIAVAFFLGRGLEPWRPRDVRWLGLAVLAAILAPVVVDVLVAWVQAVGGEAATFVGFAGGVLLIGYMVLAGCWALRFLAEQTAHAR
jgi:hypothetical protein